MFISQDEMDSSLPPANTRCAQQLRHKAELSESFLPPENSRSPLSSSAWEARRVTNIDLLESTRARTTIRRTTGDSKRSELQIDAPALLQSGEASRGALVDNNDAAADAHVPHDVEAAAARTPHLQGEEEEEEEEKTEAQSFPRGGRNNAIDHLERPLRAETRAAVVLLRQGPAKAHAGGINGSSNTGSLEQGPGSSRDKQLPGRSRESNGAHDKQLGSSRATHG